MPGTPRSCFVHISIELSWRFRFLFLVCLCFCGCALLYVCWLLDSSHIYIYIYISLYIYRVVSYCDHRSHLSVSSGWNTDRPAEDGGVGCGGAGGTRPRRRVFAPLDAQCGLLVRLRLFIMARSTRTRELKRPNCYSGATVGFPNDGFKGVQKVMLVRHELLSMSTSTRIRIWNAQHPIVARGDSPGNLA